jgi:hypothetical protein
MEFCMNLKISQGFPHNVGGTIRIDTSMRELTKVNAVLDDRVYFLEEITGCITIWATNLT